MPETDSPPVTVLVVDDYEDIRQLLRFMLETCGYLVLEAENGQTALDLACERCPDLILMDVDMPVLDGLSATRRLRETEGVRHIPVIIITAHSHEQYRPAAFAAGCTEFHSKPINFDDLVLMMHRCMAT